MCKHPEHQRKISILPKGELYYATLEGDRLKLFESKMFAHNNLSLCDEFTKGSGLLKVHTIFRNS